MASLSGVSSSNTLSSLMNSANMISGLASGLDTESMIESLVKSYQTKISQLNQKVTKTEWKQDAYRSIIQKMYGFSSQYTSYTSSTNLASPSFFNSAVNVETLGKFADRVSASGKTSSDIALNAVQQLATSAQYRTASNLKAGDGRSIAAEAGIDLVNGKTELGRLNGSLALTYGSKTVSIQFDEVADVKTMDEIRSKLAEEKHVDKDAVDSAEVLAGLINQKLADQKISLTGGTTDTADNRIKVEANNGKISFSDKSTAGNSVYLSQASGNVADVLGLNLKNANETKPASFTLSTAMKEQLTKQVNNGDYLSNKTMSLTLDGTTKTIKLPAVAGGKLMDADGNISDLTADNYAAAVNTAVQKAFKGSKITVTNASGDDSLQLRFEVQEGSELLINTDVGETLGIGRTATSYMNTNKTLEDLLGEDALSKLKPAMVKDENGNLVEDKDEKTGELKYEFIINDTVIGSYTKDTKLADIMAAINSNQDAGVRVSYSQTTKNFLFTSKETGLESEIKMGKDLAEDEDPAQDLAQDLARAMFGSTKIPDHSGSSFAESYNISWLEGDAKENITVAIEGHGRAKFDVTNATTISDVVNNLNGSVLGGNYTFAYNKYSGQIEAKDKQSGAVTEFTIESELGSEIRFDESKAPEVDYTAGQDAKFSVTVNGETKNMTRSSNTVSIDGLTITMKDVFDGSRNEDGTPAVDSTGRPKNPVTFRTTTDSDKIVDAVKTMIADYNIMMSEIKSAYSTLPYQKTDGSFANYEPLTDEERQEMSESAIERYEEKAKQGILFADRDLSSLYNKLRGVFSPAGEDGSILRGMGITTSYDVSTGALTINLDEDKLRSMLDSDPDMVADAFTKTSGIGGVMQNLKTTLDTYAKTSGEPKGILIQKAGSPLSPLSLMSNTWQKEIDNLNTQIQNWQDKLANQVDRYTQQFTRLEMLINQMNSQSSTLAGMMGG